MGTTYQKLAEVIRTNFYDGIPSDDAQYSLRHVAEMIAMEVALEARNDAFANSNLGETTYANDQFTSVFRSIPIVSSNGEKYSTLPATPTSLPNNQEIMSVNIDGSTCIECIPMRGKDYFMQGILGYPPFFVFYRIEDGKVYYISTNPLIEGTATIKMVGSVSATGNILDAVLNVPKSVEASIMDRILQRLQQTKRLPQDIVNDATDRPTV